EWIRQRIGAKDSIDLGYLIEQGWLLRERCASRALAGRKQSARLVETEAETETEAQKAVGLAVAHPPAKPPTGGTRLDPLWTLPVDWLEWALGERPDWTAPEVERV